MERPKPGPWGLALGGLAALTAAAALTAGGAWWGGRRLVRALETPAPVSTFAAPTPMPASAAASPVEPDEAAPALPAPDTTRLASAGGLPLGVEPEAPRAVPKGSLPSELRFSEQVAAASEADLEPVKSGGELMPLVELKPAARTARRPLPRRAPARALPKSQDCPACESAEDSHAVPVAFPDEAGFRAAQRAPQWMIVRGLGACSGGYAYELRSRAPGDLRNIIVTADTGESWSWDSFPAGGSKVIRSGAPQLRFAIYSALNAD